MCCYCDNCQKNVAYYIDTKKKSYSVYGEEIAVNAQIKMCDECGEELFDEKLDREAQEKAHLKYRKAHKFLSPSEIREIREMYGLSQRGFSRILGWGDKTMYRYENGSLQDKAHDTLLTMLKNPDNMKSFVIEKEVIDKEKTKKRLLSTINALIQNHGTLTKEGLIARVFPIDENIENGFRVFDYDKFCSTVQYFLNKSKKMPKVKLMKLMFYSDFLNYKENGISISGSRYVHTELGPVPEKHDFVYGIMEESGFSHLDIRQFENNLELHRIIIDRPIKSTLTTNELSILERIQNRFSSFDSKKISDYSNGEIGYRETQLNDIIPYSYASMIKV